MASRKSFVAEQILQSGLIADRFQILYPGAISLPLGDPSKWEEVLGPEHAVVHAFEADKEEHGRADGKPIFGGPAQRCYDEVLWDEEGEVTLHVNETKGASSLFPHNFATVDRWGPMGLGRDICEVRLNATTVADWARREGVGDLDFARLNVEGAELAVLRGMGPLLDRIVAMVVEVNFFPDYFVGAPVFSDIDLYLRQQGFTFFDFLDNTVYVSRHASPLSDSQRAAYFPRGGRGRQLLQDHVLYLRDPISETSKGGENQLWSRDKVLKLAFWADLYGQTDFAFEVLAWLRDRADGQDTKSAIGQMIYGAKSRFDEARESETIGDWGHILRLQKRERQLNSEVRAQSRMINSQAEQIERMHRAYAELLRENLRLSGVLTE